MESYKEDLAATWDASKEQAKVRCISILCLRWSCLAKSLDRPLQIGHPRETEQGIQDEWDVRCRARGCSGKAVCGQSGSVPRLGRQARVERVLPCHLQRTVSDSYQRCIH